MTFNYPSFLPYFLNPTNCEVIPMFSRFDLDFTSSSDAINCGTQFQLKNRINPGRSYFHDSKKTKYRIKWGTNPAKDTPQKQHTT